jgi:hypothetical protein
VSKFEDHSLLASGSIPEIPDRMSVEEFNRKYDAEVRRTGVTYAAITNGLMQEGKETLSRSAFHSVRRFGATTIDGIAAANYFAVYKELPDQNKIDLDEPALPLPWRNLARVDQKLALTHINAGLDRTGYTKSTVWRILPHAQSARNSVSGLVDRWAESYDRGQSTLPRHQVIQVLRALDAQPGKDGSPPIEHTGGDYMGPPPPIATKNYQKSNHDVAIMNVWEARPRLSELRKEKGQTSEKIYDALPEDLRQKYNPKKIQNFFYGQGQKFVAVELVNGIEAVLQEAPDKSAPKSIANKKSFSEKRVSTIDFFGKNGEDFERTGVSLARIVRTLYSEDKTSITFRSITEANLSRLRTATMPEIRAIQNAYKKFPDRNKFDLAHVEPPSVWRDIARVDRILAVNKINDELKRTGIPKTKVYQYLPYAPDDKKDAENLVPYWLNQSARSGHKSLLRHQVFQVLRALGSVPGQDGSPAPYPVDPDAPRENIVFAKEDKVQIGKVMSPRQQDQEDQQGLSHNLEPRKMDVADFTKIAQSQPLPAKKSAKPDIDDDDDADPIFHRTDLRGKVVQNGDQTVVYSRNGGRATISPAARTANESLKGAVNSIFAFSQPLPVVNDVFAFAQSLSPPTTEIQTPTQQEEAMSSDRNEQATQLIAALEVALGLEPTQQSTPKPKLTHDDGPKKPIEMVDLNALRGPMKREMNRVGVEMGHIFRAMTVEEKKDVTFDQAKDMIHGVNCPIATAERFACLVAGMKRTGMDLEQIPLSATVRAAALEKFDGRPHIDAVPAPAPVAAPPVTVARQIAPAPVVESLVAPIVMPASVPIAIAPVRLAFAKVVTPAPVSVVAETIQEPPKPEIVKEQTAHNPSVIIKPARHQTATNEPKIDIGIARAELRKLRGEGGMTAKQAFNALPEPLREKYNVNNVQNIIGSSALKMAQLDLVNGLRAVFSPVAGKGSSIDQRLVASSELIQPDDKNFIGPVRGISLES